MEDKWFIARYEAATYALMQMNMMGKDRSDAEFKGLDDWINKNEDKYLKLTTN